MKSFKRWFNLFLMSSLGIATMLMPLSPGVQALDDSSAATQARIIYKANGQYNQIGTTPSPVIAVNSSRIFELLNNQYYIINRSSGSGIQGTATDIAHSGNIYLTDPQVMWDPYTSRFYYSYEEKDNSGRHGINWGFSKTADPNSAADFCSYFSVLNYGANYWPDKQNMGDNKGYIFFANERVEINSSGQYLDVGSDLDWFSKPPAGNSCPPRSVFKIGIQSLTNSPPTGDEYTTQPAGYPYYPVVAKQVDPSPYTWIVALPTFASGNYLNMIEISTGSNGLPVVHPTVNIQVADYTATPQPSENTPLPGTLPQGPSQNINPAPQLETSYTFNQMYMAYDPRLGLYTLWTAHPVAGGDGSAIRWYEIFPAGNKIEQQGTISSPNLDFFNPAIAPDRAYVYGSGAKYGADMAITYSATSTTTDPEMMFSAKVGAMPISAPRVIISSLGPDDEASCVPPETNYPQLCRYGDWPGAAPDPAGLNNKGTTGQVWLSNEWNIAQTATDPAEGPPVWRTELAEIGF